MSSSYKQLTVPSRSRKQTIKKFIESQGHRFSAGSAFVQLTEAEELSKDKTYIATRDGTTFLTGAQLRKAVKAPAGNRKFTLDPAKHDKYSFYVEARSHNKQVQPGTSVLVKEDEEVDTTDPVPDPVPAPALIPPTKGLKRIGIHKTSVSESPKKLATEPVVTIKAPTTATTNRTTAPSVATTTMTPVKPSVGEYEDIQIVFSYDTTGSMSACIERVKRTVQETIRRLLTASTNIEIAVMAHGDYRDEHETYLLKYCNFSSNENELCTFIQNVGHTCGYDFEEAYEYVLNKARTELTWKEKANKCIVMIGDATPHAPHAPDNRSGVDWRQEAVLLKAANIKCYAVRCLAWPDSTTFYKQLASLTGGFYLELAQFNAITDFMVAISMREAAPENLENFSQEIQQRDGNLTRNMRQLFATLTGNEAQVDSTPEDLTAVAPGRFQLLEVDRDEPIKQFVIRNGAKFVKGKGFYEFMKPEEVQWYKEVVLMDKATGDMFTGDRARQLAGIGAHVKGKKERPPPSDKWVMFIQSTSYNRKLIAGTKFLYEAARDPVIID